MSQHDKKQTWRSEGSIRGAAFTILRNNPPAIAEIDNETKDIVLRTGNKSALLDVFKQKGGLVEWYNEIDEDEHTSSVVVDVMWFIRSLSPMQNE